MLLARGFDDLLRFFQVITRHAWKQMMFHLGIDLTIPAIVEESGEERIFPGRMEHLATTANLSQETRLGGNDCKEGRIQDLESEVVKRKKQSNT